MGIIQGITEWLPISSEGVIFLVKINLLNSLQSVETMVKTALFLHLGTLLAVLIYFRKEIIHLLKALFKYSSADLEEKQILKFLIISTLISGTFGFLLLKSFSGIIETNFTGRLITGLIGVFLLLTAFIQIKSKKKKTYKKAKDLTNSDSILLGFVQGLAVLPGLSRSGLTVSALLLRKFDDFDSLRLSFLMSLPIVLAGNIILNFEYFSLTVNNAIAIFFAFLFGILTIDLLLKLAKKVNFGYFVLLFGLITIIAVFI